MLPKIFLPILFLIFSPLISISQTVDKLRLVYDEKEIVSKQVGVTVSNDGRLAAFAYANKVIKIVNLISGKTLTKLKGNYNNLFEIRFNYNAKKIITAGDKNSIGIYDIEIGKADTAFNVPHEISKLDISVMGNYIAVGQYSSYLYVYDIDSRKAVINKQLKKHHICAIDFNPIKNEIAVAKVNFTRSALWSSDKGNVEIFDLKTGNLLKKVGKGKYAAISYSSDGKKLYMSGVGKKYLNVGLNFLLLYLPKYKNILQYHDFETGKLNQLIASNKFSSSSDFSSICLTSDYFLSCNQGNSFDVVDLKTTKKVYTTQNEQFVRPKNFSKLGVGISRIYPLADGKSFFINSADNNICQIYNSEKNSISAYIYSDANDDFVVVGRDGRLDGEQSAIAKLFWSERKSSKRTPIENTFDQFYTPDLLAQLLKGVKLEEIKLDIENLKPVPELKFIYPTVGDVEFRGTTNVSLVTDTKALKLEFSATDKGGGLNELRVYQNGKLVNSTIEEINTLDKGVSKVVNIELFPGENAIKIVATNKDKIESSTNTIVKYNGTSNEPSKLFVMAIGINKYQKSTYDLSFAVPDATGFIEAIKVASKDLFAEVNITLLQDEKATKQNVLKELERIKPFVKQGDVFVFYYAGHGAMTIAAQGEQSVFNLVPNDVTNFYSTEMLKEKGISTSELQKISKEMNAQKQLFVIDACQSGGAVDALASRGALNEKELANLARSTGTYFLTASGSDQLAGEFAALGHGVFTYAILQAFTGKADGVNGDSKVSVKELSLFVENAVPNLSEKYKGQRQFPVSYGYGQDFPIVVSNKYILKDVTDGKIGKYSSMTLEELMKLKQKAIQDEDFDAAKEIKIEIEKRK
jgi:hypothetical protein